MSFTESAGGIGEDVLQRHPEEFQGLVVIREVAALSEVICRLWMALVV
jgi:hypothetical protein